MNQDISLFRVYLTQTVYYNDDFAVARPFCRQLICAATLRTPSTHPYIRLAAPCADGGGQPLTTNASAGEKGVRDASRDRLALSNLVSAGPVAQPCRAIYGTTEGFAPWPGKALFTQELSPLHGARDNGRVGQKADASI